MANVIFMPQISGGAKVEPVISQSDKDEENLFLILKYHPRQQRKNMRRHPLLDKAAQAKADDMAKKGYFAHTSPDGVSANQNVRNVGYKLPNFYPAGSNNVESLSVGGNSPQDNADGWLRSDKHRPQVYGEDKFYREQECVGIGKAVSKIDGRNLYVFLSAPCYG